MQAPFVDHIEGGVSAPLLEALRRAQHDGEVIDSVPPHWLPASLEEAYAIAADLTSDRGTVAGWKIGATSPQAQQLLELREPFFGRIFADGVHLSPSRVQTAGRTLALEPEIAFVMGADLPARGETYGLDEVRAAIGAFVPALEINWPPYARPFEAGALCLVAANGVNAGVVLGEARPLPPDDVLLEIVASLTVDGVEGGRGRCAETVGPPVPALAWLANALCARGSGLRRGDIVCIGALTRPAEGQAGREVLADFGSFGQLEVALVP